MRRVAAEPDDELIDRGCARSAEGEEDEPREEGCR